MKSLKIPRKVKKEITNNKSVVKFPMLKNCIIVEQETFNNLQSFNNNVSLSFALEAVQNDVQINALNKKLNDLYMYSTPKYVMQTNGEINAINSKEFDEAVAKIVEQIELRRQQIMFAYNCQ